MRTILKMALVGAALNGLVMPGAEARGQARQPTDNGPQPRSRRHSGCRSRSAFSTICITSVPISSVRTLSKPATVWC